MTDLLNPEIAQALSELGPNAPLRDGTTALLETLGYSSDRTAEVGGVDGLLALLEEGKSLTERQRALFDTWRSAEIVFQLTGEEIVEQSSLFQDFEKGRAKSFLFIATDLEHPRYSRTDLAEMTRAVNRGFLMPVIVLFRHGTALTLAAIHRRAHRRDGERDVLERVSLIKDIRTGNPHRAHVDTLGELALPRLIGEGVRTFDDLHTAWERVLDIEELNRRFYRELFGWFQRAVTEARFPDDGAGAGSTERHVIRLITRILFIWFLKEKGLVVGELFEKSFACTALRQPGPELSDYYRAVLQNLFFATLNTEIQKRAFSKQSYATHRDFYKYRYRDLLVDPDGFVEQLKSVPFVNGGLFDCLDDFSSASQGGHRIDMFSDPDPSDGPRAAEAREQAWRELNVPDALFFDDDGLFPLLSHYKFTVEENTPLDREVALDPELLGRVFENLLAAHNPETRETARKATGSYYTPRQVVDYMVREALVEAVADKTNPADGDQEFWRERLLYLLDYSDAMDDADDLFEDTDRRALVAAITNLKVLDPAVGSGAFPMGILQTLTLALRRLDPDNALWEDFQKERAKARAGAAFDVADQGRRDNALQEISDTFERYRQTDFGRKLYLIQNSIYGVDVQPIACQIAKLRFFISLVIEQDPDFSAPNLGVKPLPNLETRFVAADTLVGLAEEMLSSERAQELETQLGRNREWHFHAATRSEKLQCRDEDERLRSSLATELRSIGMPAGDADKVAKWDPYDQNRSSDWFDPEYMFGVADGFDVVIGNPPYVESRSPHVSSVKKQQYGNQVTSEWNATLPKGSDLLIYFLARSAGLLNSTGEGSLITQNAWLSTNYGFSFQEFSKGRFSFRRIVDTSSRFFSDRSGPNINAIIASFNKANTASIEYAIADENMQLTQQRSVSTNGQIKWGHLFSMPSSFQEIFGLMSDMQDTTSRPTIQFGQGVNVPMSRLNIDGAEVGILLKDVRFVAESVNDFLCRQDVSDRRLAKAPALTLPRGIGDRHYCTFNLCKAQSFSAVELYLLDESLWESDLHYCLWVYLNSSVVWLFREITGRKNLGGGMLKAEATDMKVLPIAFSFDFGQAAREVFQALKLREPLAVSQELITEEHKAIDGMIGNFFGFDSDQLKYVQDVLLEKVDERKSRATKRG